LAEVSFRPLGEGEESVEPPGGAAVEFGDQKGGQQVTLTAGSLLASRDAGVRPRLLARSTPARLRLVTSALALLALLTGLVAALATTQRQSATSASWQTAEPLMVTAQSIDTSLSDADTTAAASFLKGRIEPAALQIRYSNDLTTASADLATAAQGAGSDPGVVGALQTLSTDLPVYTSIVSEANFNERQASYPLAAAYLAEANNLMRTNLLPAAALVYATESRRLASDQDHAVSIWLALVTICAFLSLLGALVVTQRWLSRRFNRTWNIALAAATAIVLGIGLWTTIAFVTQNTGVNDAQATGSQPVSTFTQARILALRARADDELTLLTRDSDSTYQQDFRSTQAALRNLVAAGGIGAGAANSNERQQLGAARRDVAAYDTVHAQIRQDDPGKFSDAVTLASGSAPGDLPTASGRLNAVLASGIQRAQANFDGVTSSASSDLDGLVWGIALGTVLVAGLIVLALRPRIEEYR
jgi:hypothetical protein